MGFLQAAPERDALARLLAEGAWLERVASKLVAEEDLAHDLVQETWLSAISRPPESLKSPRAWLRVALTNQLRMHLRRERSRPDTAAACGDDEPMEAAPHGAAAVERKEFHDFIAANLDILPEPYRSTLVLYYFKGLSTREIGRRDGIATHTVRWRRMRALEDLRMRLTRSTEGARPPKAC